MNDWELKTEQTPRVVVRVNSVFICLAYDCTIKDEWNVPCHDVVRC
jgi:hypothetical protein